MDTAWIPAPLPMESRKPVFPPGTNATFVEYAPDATVSVPARSETVASMRAVTDAEWCPETMGRSTRSSTVEAHVEAMPPSMRPGDQEREVTDREHSSPSIAGSG